MGQRILAVCLSIAVQQPSPPTFGLSSLERAGGWVSLSEETARAGWGELAAGWSLQAGVLRRAPGATEYATWDAVLAEFEMDFEWREDPAADGLWRSGRVVLQRDGSALALLGDQRFEHDPNTGMPSFEAGPVELTPAQIRPGWRLALRPGASALELRAVKLRDRGLPLGKRVSLFDGATLAGWKSLGDARFSVVDGELRGEVGGGSQSFLRTEQSFGDFVLELELRNEAPGNSGVQVRSHETENARLRGYQIEVDPLARAWSGGLYDEARRGWLDDLSDNPLGRAAFKPGAWNRYRIECIGPWIRAWVNDVPTADYLDAMDFEGVIGLQVHSGKDTRMRWRNLQLVELGRTDWAEAMLEQEPVPRAPLQRLRSRLPEAGGTLRLRLQCQDAGAPQTASLTLRGADWQAQVPCSFAAAAAHEIVLHCYPPRLAIEVDGLRLPQAALAPRASDGKTSIEFELECPLALMPAGLPQIARR